MRVSKRNLRTVAHIVAAKANEMYKRGAAWRQGNRNLSCAEMGNVSNRILRHATLSKDGKTFEKFSFPWDKKKK